MASTLTWLDYSERDRRRALDVIDLFRETSTVDELGLAGVRDSFSDFFFPGTTTIQTRACYFLFVPWTMLWLEHSQVPTSKAAEKARQKETNLNRRLLLGFDTRGVFGSQAGDALKRLPSEVYWGGLGNWGIRTFSGHRSAYLRSLDGFYRRVAAFRSTPADREGRQSPPGNWHAHLPEPPSGFRWGEITVALRPEDAAYLRDRIENKHPNSLLAALAGRSDAADLAYGWPWELDHLTEHSRILRVRLRDSKLLAVCMHGAALLYNLMLSELQRHDQRTTTFRDGLERWAVDLAELERELRDWQLDDVWRVVREQGRSLGFPTKTFIERWIQLLKRGGPDAVVNDGPDARRLVQEREEQLKRGRARLASRRHRELWGGDSGSGRMDFRWGVTKRILADIFDGLARSEDDARNA